MSVKMFAKTRAQKCECIIIHHSFYNITFWQNSSTECRTEY